MDVDAHLAFGMIINEGEEDLYSFGECPAMADGLAEWLYNAIPRVDLVWTGYSDEPTFILALQSYSADWSAAQPVQIDSIKIDEEEKERFILSLKALCRYLGIQYKEPQWFLSCYMSY